MNKTAIEWTDFTFNPVTGCWGPGGTAEKPNRCAYCYAEKVANRFYGKDLSAMEKVNLSQGPFAPRFHPDRLNQPHKVLKPSKIFVCSMADLFGDWVPNDWIDRILGVARACKWHTFQFLTKNPQRLKDFNPWPKNCWVGTTVTNQADADERLPWLTKVDAQVRFVSHEPLMGQIDVYGVRPVEACHWVDPDDGCCSHPDRINPECHLENPCSVNQFRWQAIDWAIIGAQTGPGAVPPKPEWVQGLIDQCRVAGVPVFLKDNLHWREKIQEWPK